MPTGSIPTSASLPKYRFRASISSRSFFDGTSSSRGMAAKPSRAEAAAVFRAAETKLRHEPHWTSLALEDCPLASPPPCVPPAVPSGIPRQSGAGNAALTPEGFLVSEWLDDKVWMVSSPCHSLAGSHPPPPRWRGAHRWAFSLVGPTLVRLPKPVCVQTLAAWGRSEHSRGRGVPPPAG
eukprot:Skav221395  [mRNA]  locus=scaffold1029:223883:246745:- [translate_table: standard]